MSRLIYNLDSYSRRGETLRMEILSASNIYFTYNYVIDTFYFYTVAELCAYLKRILDSFNPSFIFTVTEDAPNHKLVIQINAGNISGNENRFRLFLGNSPTFANIIGHETSNQNTHIRTLVSTKPYNLTAQLSFATNDLRTLVNLTSVRLDYLYVETSSIFNVSDNNNRLSFQVKKTSAPTVEVSYTIYLPSARYTPSEFATAVETAMNAATTNADFACSYSTTTRRLTFSLTGGTSVSTYRILWYKSHASLTRMCGFNRDTAVSYRSGSDVGSMAVDFEYPKNVFVQIDNINYQQPILNNRAMFMISLSRPVYDSVIYTNSSITELAVRLYDDYSMPLPIQVNWGCVFSFNV